ncbi:Mor transcription activator family protein [Cedecea neteri]|uniref:Mor transcription activator family protein n=1 Tax=Cedecea neteri TaxID=158822 RepID=UPI002AA95A3E|nr:Mor transcription activator family protein [Cedecea neteri]WPU22586.1 Mor transcription activator family protein [Cedecea neteri]
MELEQVKSLLPETVLNIAELIGFPATVELIKILGGTTFPVGKGVRALGASRMRMLKEAVGDANTTILIENYGGTLLYLPRCDRALRELRNRSFIDEFELLREQGVSSLRVMTELCPKYGFSDRFAWGLLSYQKQKVTIEQGNLF